MRPDHPSGDYSYLPGISAFSCGTVARAGHEIVHVTLAQPVPWRAGFQRIDGHLREQGRARTALCGIELRSPAAFTFAGFDQFNAGYRGLLADWGILVGDDNPIPRTNVAPVVGAPTEPSLYAFAYTVPGRTPAPPSSWPARASCATGPGGRRASCATARPRRRRCARRPGSCCRPCRSA
jgi:hypothetical protein